MDPARESAATDAWPRRLTTLAVELAIVGAAWWYFGLVLPVGLALCGAVILSGVVPPRYESLASGAGLLGIAALAYFGYHQEKLAAVLGVIGVLMLIRGGLSLKRRAGG